MSTGRAEMVWKRRVSAEVGSVIFIVMKGYREDLSLKRKRVVAMQTNSFEGSENGAQLKDGLALA